MKTTYKTIKTLKKRKKGKWIRLKYPSRPDAYKAFAEWMAYPKSVRSPRTQGLFAQKHEVSQNTLSSYKKKPEFWEKVEENKIQLERDIEDSILLAQAIAELGN